MRHTDLRCASSQGWKLIMKNPKTAVIVSLLLCMPLAVILWMAVLGIEFPSQSPANQPDVACNLLFLGAVLLLPLALAISLAPVVRNKRRGGLWMDYPANLMLAGIILAVLLIIVGAFIADQYPCWIGMPNCD
jgi:hypothetical protein